MKKFKIKLTPQAQQDINRLFTFIVNEYKSPETAEKYVEGLYETIDNLLFSADSIAYSRF